MTRASGPLLFTPARATFGELDQTFVGRRALLDQLESDLCGDAKGKTARHWQLIGPRGTGKSHFTELLGHRLRKRGWEVVRLPEEHYQVASVGELLEQIVMRLDHLELSPFRDTVSARDVEEQALDYLRGWRKKHARSLLVVLENLELLFERQLASVREQSRLREILMRDAPFVLLTTSTSYLESTGRHAAPFYDFFHVHTLDELSRAEVVDLVEARARWDQEEALLRDFGSVKARLDALYHLSGGNPRLVLALYSIIRQGVTSELHHQLLKLLDDVTPYYQGRLRDIAPQMERVLVEMALAERAVTPSELARRCRMATNQVTANVAKLVGERLVRSGGRPDARRRYYEVSDRLFRIWLQMREDSTARQQLKFLIEFFQSWYRDSIKLAKRALGLATWSDTNKDLDALKMLISRRKEGERASLPSDLQDALVLYDQEQALPYWLLRDAACDLSHTPSQEARAASLLKEIVRRDGSLDADTLTHALELLIRMESTDAIRFGELASWLIANGSPQQIREHFVSEMPGLIRRTGGRGALRLYRQLRDAGILPPDLPPYATAEVVETSPQPTMILESLHPEVREAVSLLLSCISDTSALRSRSKGDAEDAKMAQTPDTAPSRPRTKRSRAARTRPAENRRRTER